MYEIDFELPDSFVLENGDEIRPLKLRCSVYGRLNEDRSNAVLVYHALSGSSRIHEWWGELLGNGLTLDTSKHAIICINYPGSCYGSTTARILRKRIGKTPLITARDIVRANQLLFEYLGIKRFERVIGASIGGMLALRHSVDFPETVNRVIAIGAAPLTPLGLALNHLQRQAVENNDLGLARKIALLTYKSSALLELRFGRKPNRNGEDPFRAVEDRFDVAGYLDQKAVEFEKRFDSESYLVITKMMDLFELSKREIKKITSRVDLIGISSDWLFPASSIEAFGKTLRAGGVDVGFHEIESDGGHDAFLAEPEKVTEIFLNLNKHVDRRAAA